MIPKAHIPGQRKPLAPITSALCASGLTSEREREVEERHCCPSARAEAVVHDSDIRVLSAQLGVQDDESDCPVGYAAEYDEQDQTSEEAGLPHCVWEALTVAFLVTDSGRCK